MAHRQPSYPPEYNPHVVPKLVSKPWLRPDAPRVHLLNGRVVDTVNGKILDGLQDVTIAAGKIVSISPSTDRGDQVEGVDLDGKWVCPGLIDCHIHLCHAPGVSSVAESRTVVRDQLIMRVTYLLKTILARGFTTVRDLGGANKLIADAIDEGVIAGPRLFQCGYAISQTGGHGDSKPGLAGGSSEGCCGHVYSVGRTADGVPAVLKAVREEIKAGADFIKLMIGGGVASPYDTIESIQFTEDEVRAATETARRGGGKMCTAHAYTDEAIKHAVDNGVMGIEHGNLLSEATAKMMAEKGIWLTPTLATYGAMGRPPFDKALPPSGNEKRQHVMEGGLRSLKYAYDAGVKMCLGTDLLSSMHALQTEEFVIRSMVLPAAEILRQATVNPAEMLGQKGKLGIIAPGAIADILILNSDPLADITSFNEPETNLLAVLKEGRLACGKLSGFPSEQE